MSLSAPFSSCTPTFPFISNQFCWNIHNDHFLKQQKSVKINKDSVKCFIYHLSEVRTRSRQPIRIFTWPTDSDCHRQRFTAPTCSMCVCVCVCLLRYIDSTFIAPWSPRLYLLSNSPTLPCDEIYCWSLRCCCCWFSHFCCCCWCTATMLLPSTSAVPHSTLIHSLDCVKPRWLASRC